MSDEERNPFGADRPSDGLERSQVKATQHSSPEETQCSVCDCQENVPLTRRKRKIEDSNVGSRILLEIAGGALGYAMAFGLSYLVAWPIVCESTAEGESCSQSDRLLGAAIGAMIASIPLGSLGLFSFGKMAGLTANYGEAIAGAALGGAVAAYLWLSLSPLMVGVEGPDPYIALTIASSIVIAAGSFVVSELIHRRNLQSGAKMAIVPSPRMNGGQIEGGQINYVLRF